MYGLFYDYVFTGDPCNQSLCYYTSIPPCCPDARLVECNSTSELLVHGVTIDVKFYNLRRLNGKLTYPLPLIESRKCYLQHQMKFALWFLLIPLSYVIGSVR